MQLGLARHPPALGVVVFLALQLFFALTWELLFQPARLEVPWFLGSRKSLVVTQVVVGVVAAIDALPRPTWRSRLSAAAQLGVGLMSAMIGVFFLVGPGLLMVGPAHLWPVALASALFLIAPAVVAGSLLGGYLGGRKK